MDSHTKHKHFIQLNYRPWGNFINIHHNSPFKNLISLDGARVFWWIVSPPPKKPKTLKHSSFQVPNPVILKLWHQQLWRDIHLARGPPKRNSPPFPKPSSGRELVIPCFCPWSSFQKALKPPSWRFLPRVYRLHLPPPSVPQDAGFGIRIQEVQVISSLRLLKYWNVC